MSGRVSPLHRSVPCTVRGLKISRLAVVEKRNNGRVVMDLTVGHGLDKDADLDKAPECGLGHVLFRCIAQTRSGRELVRAEVPV